MTAGRKPIKSSIDNAVEAMPPETIKAIEHDMAESAAYPAALVAAHENLTALAKTLGYEGSLAPDVLEDGVRESLDRINFEMFAAGARLLLLKEQCAHGEFLERLEHLGLEDRAVRRMMRATLKFSNRASTPDLARLGKTKLFELTVLDDDETDEFVDGGSVRGITYDEVAKMSVSALRARLRQVEADQDSAIAKVRSDVSGQLAAKDRLIADGKKRIADLVEEKNRSECMTDGERIVELERRLTEHTLVAVGALIPVRKSVHAARSLDHCPQGLYVALQGALDRVIAEAMSIATDYGIQLNLTQWPEEDDELGDPNQGEVTEPIFPVSE